MQIFFLYESLVSAVFNNNDFYLIINEKLILVNRKNNIKLSP